MERDSIVFRNGSFIPIHPDYPEFSYSKSYESLGFNESLGRSHSIPMFFRSQFYNCHGLSIPYDKDFQEFWFRIKSTIFPSGIRSNDEYSLITIIHYPNQMLNSYHTLKYSWPEERNEKESYVMRFKIERVEVVRRRQKDRLPCHENWEDYDNEIMRTHIKNSGCRPLYFRSSLGGSSTPVCSTREQMKRAQFNYRSDGYGLLPPCTSMEEISYTYEESIPEPNFRTDGRFYIGILFFNRSFKDILQTR